MKIYKWLFPKSLKAVLWMAFIFWFASCRQPYDVSFLQKDTYYIGSIDSEELVVSFSSLNGETIYGDYYEIEDNEEIEPKTFEYQIKKNRSVLKTKDNKCKVKLIDLQLDADTLYGYSKIGDKELCFEFYPYTEPSYQTYPPRYVTKLFQYKLLPDIRYGTARGYWTSRPVKPGELKKTIAQDILKRKVERDQPLLMDIYMPVGDTLSYRPLIMFLHGGGFLFGDKTDGAIVQWCRHYASMGYVVASVNYRMGFKTNKQSVERCGYQAVQDAHAAMRFLVHNREKYRIDTSCLFVGGSSAGSITSLNLAFMQDEDRPASTYAKGRKYDDLGNVASSGNDLKETFRIRAVANMWGAVQDIDMLSHAKANIISFHGDADNIVPYGYDVPFKGLPADLGEVFFEKMYGSSYISQKAKELGYREEFYTFHGAGHPPHCDENDVPNEKFYFIQDKMTNFFYKELLPEKPEIFQKAPQYYQLNVAPNGILHWKAYGGLILETSGNEVRVVWLKNAPAHKLVVAGRTANGAAFEAIDNLDVLGGTNKVQP